MKKLQPFPKWSRNQTLFNASSVFQLGLVNIFHFILEFSALKQASLPYFFIIFHMIGVTAGALFSLEVAYKWNNLVAYLCYFILFISFLISLEILIHPLYIPFALFGAGFCIGGISGFGMVNTFSGNPEYGPPTGGRTLGLGLFIASILVIIYAIINNAGIFILNLIFFALILVTSLVSTFVSKKDIQIIAQKRLNVVSFFKSKENLSRLAVAFFHGFFIINTYYAAILIFDLLGLVQYLNTFVIILFVVVVLVSNPVGVVADIIGRRFTGMIGLAIQAFAFLILSFLNQVNIALIIIFTITLGIGFTFIYIGFFQILIESPKRSVLRDEFTISMAFLGIGAAIGVVLGEVLQYLIRTNAAYLTIVLLFIFICATIAVFQVKETLPSKSEVFVRPEAISEEDLTLFKERKICLVCKGNASGFGVFVCPDCGVLYCEKCAKALSNLENMCWACDNPIDDSRPVKPIEKKEEEIKLDKELDHKGKNLYL